MMDGMLSPGLARAEIVWNPEFLREGHAIEDTLRPDRIVVGAESAGAAATIEEIYQPLIETGIPLILTDRATSELAKGAANAFLATKISFINAMADICAATGGDVSALARSLGLDPRIGQAFLKAGMGYGGACLPKDVRGLGTYARAIGAQNAATLLDAVDEINAARSRQAVALVERAVDGVAGKHVTIWGATFKAGTDDVRGSAALQVADRLRSLGAIVTVYDPMGSGNALASYPELAYADSAYAAAAGADVVLVVTAWPEFATVEPAAIGEVVREKVVVDACQGIEATNWHIGGWRVYSLTGVSAVAAGALRSGA
jgi:UDPglucose 6-dehydrogenase